MPWTNSERWTATVIEDRTFPLLARLGLTTTRVPHQTGVTPPAVGVITTPKHRLSVLLLNATGVGVREQITLEPDSEDRVLGQRQSKIPE